MTNACLVRRLRVKVESTRRCGRDLQRGLRIEYIGSLAEFEAAGPFSREQYELVAQWVESDRMSQMWRAPVSEFGDLHSLTPIAEGPYAGKYTLSCLVGSEHAWQQFDPPGYGFKQKSDRAKRVVDRFLKRMCAHAQDARQERRA